MPKETIKKTISDPQLKTELFKLFEAGNTDKGKCREVVGSKYKIQVQRFYKMFNIIIQEWQEIKDKAEAEQVGDSTKDALKSGLKSKIEWVAILQKELDDNQVEESVLDLKTGKVTRYFRKLYPMERKALYERISKFMGMDAPVSTKSEVTVTNASISIDL